jgi:hypothetical protein
VIAEDSAAAYDQLARDLKPYHITPLFRWEGDKQAVDFGAGYARAQALQSGVNLVLFIATLFSVLLVGAFYGLEQELPADPLAGRFGDGAGWLAFRGCNAGDPGCP